MSGLLCVDYRRAAAISRNWLKILNSAKSDEFVFPFTFTIEDREYMFLVKPKKMPVEEFDLYLEHILIYHRYRYKANSAYLILINHIVEEQFNVEVCEVDLTTLARYDELVEETVKAMESMI